MDIGRHTFKPKATSTVQGLLIGDGGFTAVASFGLVGIRSRCPDGIELMHWTPPRDFWFSHGGELNVAFGSRIVIIQPFAAWKGASLDFDVESWD